LKGEQFNMADDVSIAERSTTRLLVLSGGRIVAGYSVGPWRSYIYPVLTPSGLPLTEESPVDHPHHNSIWLGQDELDGYNLWLTKPGSGRVVGDVSYEVEGRTAVFRESCKWLSPEGEALLVEQRVTRISPSFNGETSNVIDIDSRRTVAGTRPVRLGQTKEAGLGMRILQQLDGEDDGTVEDAMGRRGEAATFDQEADWVGYWGTMAGKRLGLALLPHPENPKHPWFTRDYGILVWNHVRLKPTELLPGEELRLRFRLLAHDGDPREAEISRRYAEYAR
jgi:hypothetical protein